MSAPKIPFEENLPPPRSPLHPVLAVAVSAGLGAGVGFVSGDWPSAVTVFVTSAGLLGARQMRERRRRTDDGGE
ncbi:hypothetical protein BJY24_003196 [Nocardia transvalensis]|uniref:Uncharacterized protein n=1 Tax=Nocardia transvalensis TaxID=37333 RepID=A0A7W9UIF2_9NOCA|nr:hypothetical protein [Nocardia transvalensis]MBB5914329.1 hypothetical protein [Nocardia transvalensis]